MDGKSRWADNIMIERWFRSFKYEEAYLTPVSYTHLVREFSGEKSMREAFEQLIERQTCEHFEEWCHQREMAEKAA